MHQGFPAIRRCCSQGEGEGGRGRVQPGESELPPGLLAPNPPPSPGPLAPSVARDCHLIVNDEAFGYLPPPRKGVGAGYQGDISAGYARLPLPTCPHQALGAKPSALVLAWRGHLPVEGGPSCEGVVRSSSPQGWGGLHPLPFAPADPPLCARYRGQLALPPPS